jgi:hypothetical protein
MSTSNLPPLVPIDGARAGESADGDEKRAVKREIAALARLSPEERAAYDRAHPDNRCAGCTKPFDRASLKHCGRCREAHYCGAACQRAHYREHGPACEARAREPAREAPARAERWVGDVGSETPIGDYWRGGRGYGGYRGWRRGYGGYYSNPYYGYRPGGILGGIVGGLAGGVAGGVAGATGYGYGGYGSYY